MYISTHVSTGGTRWDPRPIRAYRHVTPLTHLSYCKSQCKDLSRLFSLRLHHRRWGYLSWQIPSGKPDPTGEDPRK